MRDVIGAHQEESFGIRQNHTMGLKEWHALIRKHFVDARVRDVRAGARMGRAHRETARGPPGPVWLGMARRALAGRDVSRGLRKKAGRARDRPSMNPNLKLCCAVRIVMRRSRAMRTIRWSALVRLSRANEGGVYNLLPSSERAELYPGDREDVIDFCLPGHAAKLLEGWYELEGVFGNKYRWIGEHAGGAPGSRKPGPQRLRIRGHASEGHPVRIIRERERAAGRRMEAGAARLVHRRSRFAGGRRVPHRHSGRAVLERSDG